MGGGDLNMKKSWHPLLIKNQARVWEEENKALEEKKKLDQLRKEREEERQMQELRRLQEEQTGKKGVEKLDWMYATPASGSSTNPNDLEDYLLGKKRVDKMLIADENEKVGAAHKNFIAVQSANTARDIAAKVREDPLLAIKQQEQAAYQALMANPLRLREMQERNGIAPKKDKSERRREKEERKKERAARRAEKEHRRRSRSRSASPDIRMDDSRGSSSHYRRDRRSPSPYSRRRSRSPAPRYDSSRNRNSYPEPSRNYNSDRRPPYPRSDESEESDERRQRRYDNGYDRKHPRAYSPEPNDHKRSRMSPPAAKPSAPRESAEDRAAKLAAMSTNATTMNAERRERLTALLEKEKLDLEEEARARVKSKGMGDFLSMEQKKVFGGEIGLEDRIRRGRGTLVVDAE